MSQYEKLKKTFCNSKQTGKLQNIPTIYFLATVGTNYVGLQRMTATAAPIIHLGALWLHTEMPPCRCPGVLGAFTVKPQNKTWPGGVKKLVLSFGTLQAPTNLSTNHVLHLKGVSKMAAVTQTQRTIHTHPLRPPHVKLLNKSAGLVQSRTLLPLPGPLGAGCAGAAAGVADASSPGRSVGSAVGTGARARSSRGGWRCPGPRTPAGTPGMRRAAPACAAAGGSPGLTCG